MVWFGDAPAEGGVEPLVEGYDITEATVVQAMKIESSPLAWVAGTRRQA